MHRVNPTLKYTRNVSTQRALCQPRVQLDKHKRDWRSKSFVSTINGGIVSQGDEMK